MRIALISYHTCPLATQEGKQTGGMNVYVLELAKELVKLGVEIDIFTRKQADDNQLLIEIAPGLRLFHIPAGPAETVAKEQLPEYVEEFVSQVVAVAAEHNCTYDLLDAHYYMSGLAAERLQKIWQIPIVMTFHTLSLMKNLVARSQAEQASPGRIEAEQRLAQLAACIISPSEFDQQYLQYLYEVPVRKIAVIPPGFNPDLFHLIDKLEAKQEIGADPDHRLILFVGRLEPLKGIDAIMYALKILQAKLPNEQPCLWLVGGSAEDQSEDWTAEQRRLDEVRRQLGLEGSVKFVTQQPQEKLAYFYNAAEMVVMPSHYESFGMAALEAMACCTPVITTNVAGVSYLLDQRHQALTTTVNNPLHLADQMSYLLAHPQERDEKCRQRQERVQDQTWHEVAKRVKNVWEGLIE